MKSIARNSMLMILLCSLAILLALPAGSRSLAIADEGSIPAAENPASDNALLKYLPDDYWMVTGIDAKTLMRLLSSDAVKNNPQAAPLQQILQTAKLMTGIDLENDVDSIVVFLSGDVSNKPKWVAAIHGSFDNPTVEQTLSASIFTQGFEKSTYKSKNLYTGPSASYYFPADSTLVLGDTAQLRGAIDKLDGDAQPALPDSLKNLLGRTSGDSIVWTAAKAAPLLNADSAADWRADNAELSGQLAKVETVSFSFALDNTGLLIHGLGYSSSSDNSKSLYDYLGQRRKSLLFDEGSNVVFCSLLIMSELANDGPFTRGSLKLTLPALTELWNSKVIVKPQ